MTIKTVKQTIKENFDAIYYINDPNQGDRQINIQNQFGDIGIPLIRVDATTPVNTDLTYKLQFNIDRYDRQPYHVNGNSTQQYSEIACSTSHAIALSAAKMAGYEKVLILEDDAQLTDIVLERVPREWDFLYLNYLTFTHNAGDFLTESGYYLDLFKRNESWFQSRGGLFSTSAYGVNLKRIGNDNLNDIISKMSEGVIADFFMSSYVQPNYNCFAQFDRTIKCGDFKSTIGDNYKGIEQAYKNLDLNDYITGVWDEDSTLLKFIDKSYFKSESKILTIVVGDSCEDYVLYEDSNYHTDFSRTLELGAVSDNHDIKVKDVYDIRVFVTTFPPNSNKGKREMIYKSEPTEQINNYENRTVLQSLNGDIFNDEAK